MERISPLELGNEMPTDNEAIECRRDDDDNNY
jgi:hypothetical protein